jgi:sugar-specific transcriptional regulator TrmB
MKLNDVLTDIGLSNKEANVYLAALELGPSPASDIALRAKLNRVTTYDILEKLMHKGFISTHTEKKMKIFVASSPDAIKQDMQAKYSNLRDALPDLRRLNGGTSHPRVLYYEGLAGIKRVYADTLTARTEILNYADSKVIRQYWPEYDNEYVDKRVKKKIYLRGIAPLNEYGKEVVKKNKETHREIRLVKPSEFTFSNEIIIYNSKVAIISFGKDELVGMIIDCSEVADTQRAIFMMAWELAGMGKKRSKKRITKLRHEHA